MAGDAAANTAPFAIGPPQPGTGGGTLFVIAHPDDEALFFLPSLVAAQRGTAPAPLRAPVHVLCLSTGDYYGLGRVRSHELAAAVTRAGLDARRDLTLLDHPALRDGPGNAWPQALVARAVAATCATTRAATIVTFDARGVSGHVNHSATHYGVALLARALRARGPSTALPSEAEARFDGASDFADAPVPPACLERCLALETVPVARAYIGMLDLVISLMISAWLAQQRWRRSAHAKPERTGHARTRATSANLPLALHVMAAHWTQLVWYRVLMVIFSRYTYVNTLVAM